jgi:hypothetical protein
VKHQADNPADIRYTWGRWQFSLRELLAVTAGLSVFFSAVAYAGARHAAVVFGLLAMLALCISVWLRRIRLFVLGVGILTLCLLVALFPWATQGTWSGSKSVALQFTVVGAESQRPIEGAVVLVRGVAILGYRPRFPMPGDDPGVAGQTDKHGAIILVHTFPVYGRYSLFARTGHVCFYSKGAATYWLDVSAPGYEPRYTPLRMLTGPTRDVNDATPPPMRIELKKVGPRDRARKGGTLVHPTGVPPNHWPIPIKPQHSVPLELR